MQPECVWTAGVGTWSLWALDRHTLTWRAFANATEIDCQTVKSFDLLSASNAETYHCPVSIGGRLLVEWYCCRKGETLTDPVSHSFCW